MRWPIFTQNKETGNQAQHSADNRESQSIVWRSRYLGIVLIASFSIPFVNSLRNAIGVAPLISSEGQARRFIIGIVLESTALLLLWYVMSRQRRTFKDIGWTPEFMDIPRAVGLALTIIVVTWTLWPPVQFLYRAFSGHFLEPKSLSGLLGVGISGFSLAFVLLNPFFEELIVRGYTMTEVMDVGGSPALAVVVSVGVQISYHLYQGAANCLAAGISFLVLAIYYAHTRRLVPIIMVHAFVDLFALFRGAT